MRAQTTASRPEADSEYSRGRRARRGTSEDPELRRRRRFETYRNAVLALGLPGAARLFVAEFAPLLHVHAAGARTRSVGLVGTLASGLSTATASPAIGLLLETGGGAVLILSAAARMLLERCPTFTRGATAGASASPTRSAS